MPTKNHQVQKEADMNAENQQFWIIVLISIVILGGFLIFIWQIGMINVAADWGRQIFSRWG